MAKKKESAEVTPKKSDLKQEREKLYGKREKRMYLVRSALHLELVKKAVEDLEARGGAGKLDWSDALEEVLIEWVSRRKKG